MFTVTVELLAGRYVATQYNDRSATEWPPHPARLFSAAVAAWALHGDEDPAERAALEWWERLGPPSITCSLGELELAERAPVTHYVPVNDTSVVARDTARTYQSVVDAERTVQAFDDDADPKAVAKATKKLEKASAKASTDSLSATSGVGPDDRSGILPTERSKQARQFPTMVPTSPIIAFHWNSPGHDPDTEAGHLQVLDGLLSRVGRLGHSSTPVSVWIEPSADDTTPSITLEPGTARRSLALRVASDGQLENLIRAYEGSAQGTEARTMPARIESYRRPSATPDPPASAIGENWILLEPEEGRLSVRDVAGVAKTLRAALMSVAGEGGAAIPEVISGHRPRDTSEAGDTAPSTRPHLMVLGLPFADRLHATGELNALAVVLPQPAPNQPVDVDDWHVLRTTVDRFLDERGGRLTFKGGGRPVVLRRAAVSGLGESARLDRWSNPSTTWVSVTPIALHRNPGQLGHRDPAKRATAQAKAETTVADACEQIGLPRPIGVEIHLDAPTIGTRHVRAFPPARTGRITRVQVHTRITFPEPVAGPIVLGAGRFQGLGLMSPVRVDTREVAS